MRLPILTLTLRLDFLNCAIFKYQPHVKKDISRSIDPFPCQTFTVSFYNLVLRCEPQKNVDIMKIHCHFHILMTLIIPKLEKLMK